MKRPRKWLVVGESEGIVTARSAKSAVSQRTRGLSVATLRRGAYLTAYPVKRKSRGTFFVRYSNPDGSYQHLGAPQIRELRQ